MNKKKLICNICALCALVLYSCSFLNLISMENTHGSIAWKIESGTEYVSKDLWYETGYNICSRFEKQFKKGDISEKQMLDSCKNVPVGGSIFIKAYSDDARKKYSLKIIQDNIEIFAIDTIVTLTNKKEYTRYYGFLEIKIPIRISKDFMVTVLDHVLHETSKYRIKI